MESDTALRLRHSQRLMDSVSPGRQVLMNTCPQCQRTGGRRQGKQPRTGRVVVAVLSTEGDGTATEELLTLSEMH